MMDWSGRCQRCGTETDTHIMSMYNTLLICMDCKDAEIQRNDYHIAEAADLVAYASKLRGRGLLRQAENVEQAAKKLDKK